MNSILKYRGGKSREIPMFEKYIPNSFSTYFEPFLGGGSVFFHLEPERAVIGDVNSRLVTFYRQLRNRYPEMREQLTALQREYEVNQTEYEALKKLHPSEYCENRNEELYYRLREEYNHPTGAYLDGTLYYFINKTAYSGMIRFNKRGEYNVPFGRYRNFNTSLITEAHSQLLRKAEVMCADYRELFDMAGPDDFMFLDPPYDCVFHDYGNIDNSGEFGEDAHRRLADDFRNLGCPALMVIGKTTLSESHYEPNMKECQIKRYSVNIKNRFKNDAMHIVVANY